MNLLHWAGASQDSQPPARLAMPVMARSYALFGQEPNADRTFYVAISPRLPARPPPAPERWGIVAAHRARGGSAVAGAQGIGRQERDAELIEDVEGALWTSETIERSRTEPHPPTPS